MGSFFSFIFFLLLPLAIGILTIYLSIELFEHLKKYHPATYQQSGDAIAALKRAAEEARGRAADVTARGVEREGKAGG